MPQTKLSRKKFLKISGITAAGLGLAGCELNSISPDPEPGLNLGPDPRPNDYAIYIGEGDTAIFNFIYVLEQLEAAFFTRVYENFYADITPEEERILSDIYRHEVAHRDFYKAYLGENGIQQLQFDFFATDFNNRESVLRNARLIEDVMVSMYNNIGELFANPDYIRPLLKIVSVEARHAAAVRTLLQPDSIYFAGNDIISSQGLDAINAPADVVNILFPFIIPNIDLRGLPQP